MSGIKISEVSKEESDHLNRMRDGYYKGLYERLHKKVVAKYGEDFPAIKYNYSASYLPIPNHSYFEYDKGMVNIDSEIDETLKELKVIFFNEDGNFK